ncbi:MAG TPA: hypothetical protein DDW92_03610 [Candidatus Veblenbacteria bacterium]|nr:MAG: hypothetical protein A2429_01260 [Candidatus Veblenbacteria bacterium RIFOXYC1_FULL_42_9]OHA55737.1 MAG: hypothetical protein A2388_03135 [Candidatus Veblenbacteria bacterium RIFOXYB1_FULL_43_13]OHA56952.1 MAG: hypothetical protein A2441_01840 [Candidatus Veblenbacteria bacterium RIFOXYC2_FULL_42_11]OHA57703.1 MAG: hypothetical protein A2588_03490 [Candidatus Veblenbacteria bacterium RIFOXYD1_FULL_43_11]HBH17322.1 hypothetical protein [Candidatus Veblenbacteria bacterium]
MILPLCAVVLLAAGVAIPRYTVRDLVSVESRLESCISLATYLHYDNPLEREGKLNPNSSEFIKSIKPEMMEKVMNEIAATGLNQDKVENIA